MGVVCEPTHSPTETSQLLETALRDMKERFVQILQGDEGHRMITQLQAPQRNINDHHA